MAKAFEAQRGRLRAVAYRMLGSHADAEDAVQKAWLRLSRQDTATIHNLAGWLTTVVGRISLDVLRSRQAHPAASYDDRLPEFVVTVDDGPAPEDDVRSPTRSGSRSWVVEGRITRIAVVIDPARLASMDLPGPV